ncbi:chorismate synthase [Staphylococcus aureus]|nr:chorismate synthase [Staphylococcus aureus]
MGAAPISEEERENMKRTITKPRPGHADLVGGMKYNHRDLRNVLERSSARETAARVAVKPIPTLYKPLNSVDINTKEDFKATIERSDSCAVPAASIVCEHVVAFEIAKALLEEFQSNHIEQLQQQIADRRQLNVEF